MWRPASALLLLGIVVAYGCGGSDAHEASPDDGGAGQAGETQAGRATSGGSNSGGSNSSAGGDAAAEGGAAGAESAGGTATSSEAGNSSGGASVGGAESAGAGAAGAGPVVLPDGIVADVPYTCNDTGPFANVEFDSYFYLEDWEDHALNTPGVTANSSTLSSSFGPSLIDSVDCDDGVVDGSCSTCDALWGPGSVEIDFDAEVLGALPTHVGMVWTDGGFNCDVTVTGYDADDALIYTQTVSGIGDDSNSGTTAEDRFFGIVHYAGVKRVVLANTGGGIEIDHLQYGR